MRTELYVVITIDCPECGKEVDGYNFNKMRKTEGMKVSDINVGKYPAPHNTPFCGNKMATRKTEAFDVPCGCLFGWDEVGV